jgi:hypothetical protein
MIDRSRWSSEDPDDALAGFVYSVTHSCEAPATAEDAIERVREATGRMKNDTRAALAREALTDPATVRDALALAEHYLGRLAAAEREDPTVTICLVDGAIGSTVTEQRALPWSVLVERLTWPARWPGDKLSAPAWLPVRLKDGAPMVRKDAHVAAISCLVLDIDDGAQVDEMRWALSNMGRTAAIHTTWSHSPAKHKARVIFPFAQECPRSEWAEVWAAADVWARTWGATIDPACKNPSRLYFLPALPDDTYDDVIWDWRSQHYVGELLTWRWLVAHHSPPKPVQTLPPVPSRPTWAGAPTSDLEREQRRRKAFARGLAEHRGRQLQSGGNRNTRLFGAARAVGQLSLTGAISEADGAAILLHAAISSGLSDTEARRTINNGLSTGKGDGPWDFSTM